MILTCPACDTKYVVKDDAIPPGGRQVRCAACKHSWHQEAEPVAAEPATALQADEGEVPASHVQPADEPETQIAQEGVDEDDTGSRQRDVGEGEDSPWGRVGSDSIETVDADADTAAAEAAAIEGATAEEWHSPVPDEEAGPQGVEEEFVGYAPIADDEEGPRRRWPLILVILVLIAGAAAAFWFLAPTEWKARAGIAEAGATPLQLMITTSDRQPLQSGNELVAISGRVINPTDDEQKVPPILAELRDKQTKAVVHRWTIPPPARVLAPRSSASFNSAEVDVPKGGDELTVSLGS